MVLRQPGGELGDAARVADDREPSDAGGRLQRVAPPVRVCVEGAAAHAVPLRARIPGARRCICMVKLQLRLWLTCLMRASVFSQGLRMARAPEPSTWGGWGHSKARTALDLSGVVRCAPHGMLSGCVHCTSYMGPMAVTGRLPGFSPHRLYPQCTSYMRPMAVTGRLPGNSPHRLYPL